jgi:striatin 1/3/4
MAFYQVNIYCFVFFYNVKGDEQLSALPVPTSLDYVNNDLNKLIVSFSNSELRLYDLEANQLILTKFTGAASTYDGTVNTQINRVVTHHAMATAVTAHEDKHIRFFDIRSGEMTQTMVAHLDAVSDLDISPNGLVLASTGMLTASLKYVQVDHS